MRLRRIGMGLGLAGLLLLATCDAAQIDAFFRDGTLSIFVDEVDEDCDDFFDDCDDDDDFDDDDDDFFDDDDGFFDDDDD